VTFDGDRATGARWVQDGRRHDAAFDYVVDASGRAGVLCAQHFRNRQAHDVFRNVAIWGYYRGGSLLPGTPGGGINVISSPEGWYWVIPLKGDVYSVGFVTHKTRFAERKPAYPHLEAMFGDLVAESETVAGLVRDGQRAGPVRVEQDFSYAAPSYCGPGYFIAGDAACFLDPLLSTGVHLAMYSGMLAATSILAAGHGDVSELDARGFYESLYRNAYWPAASTAAAATAAGAAAARSRRSRPGWPTCMTPAAPAGPSRCTNWPRPPPTRACAQVPAPRPPPARWRR
jgi:flavin-dependent dehydrogenase